MNYAIIELKSETASFRNPEFQNYHKSYLLPPPSTIIGLTGAALGLSPESSQKFFKKEGFVIGCHGKANGRANDLWKHLKLNTQKAKDQRDMISGILSREFLYSYSLIIVFGNVDIAKIDQIINGFHNPKYALTLGNSDALVKVIKCIPTKEKENGKRISNCMVEGDIIEEVIKNNHNGLGFEIYQNSDPITYDMPVYFNYKDNEYGSRNISSRKKISIISHEMILNVEKEGVKHNNIFIPVFKI